MLKFFKPSHNCRGTMKMGHSRLLLFFSVGLIYLVIPTAAQNCYDTGNYTSNSTYRANLNTLLASMINNTKINYGFYNFSFGEAPDKVYAIALCRGDTSPSDCRSCIEGASSDLLKACPNQKEAIIWPDKCSLRYSNRSIFNAMEASPLLGFYNTGDVPDVEAFNNVLFPLLNSVRNRTASGNSTYKFAVKSASAPNYQTLYALLECTPDLSKLECNSCLEQVQSYIPQCCKGKQGGKFVTPSCDIRFEVYSFYDPSVEPPPSPPPPSPSPPPLVPSAASPPPESPTTTPGKESNSSRTTIVVVVTTISAAVLIISICICIYLRKRNPRKKVESEAEDEISVVESLRFDFGIIRVATQNFSDANKLGEGGFGIVYKGKFSNGQEIAVKRLSRNSSQGEVEFKNEVMLVAKLQHRNLVRLLGFCLEGDERLLVYEFVPNGSLDCFIFDPIKRAQLNWEKRFKIIGGIARGLLYLHEDSQLRIIHRDLKASNILLDASMKPKISDFVLEMVTGQKNNTFHIEDTGDGLINYAWKQWRDGTTSNFVDPTLRTDSTAEIMKCIHIGLLCVQENVDKRPTMASIVLMLNSESMSLSAPSQPAFLMDSSTRSNMLLVEHDSREMGSTQSKSNSVQASVNDVSISELYPR
nr:cysteine-rich receptor-like protein kinase 29 [Quercus suber]